MRYRLEKLKSKALHWFWWKVPDSVLYWATIHTWSRLTTTKFTNKHPDDVTWSMACKALEGK